MQPPLMSITLARDLRKTPALVEAWEDLAAQALEPNVFYEHWMLLPALRAYGAAADARVALVWRGATAGGAPILAGLMPLAFVTRSGRLSVSAARLWQHPHCYLGTPLIRADCARECIGALLQWLRRLGWAETLELPSLSADGPFHRLLLECCQGLRLRTWRTQAYTRGLWLQAGNGVRSPASAVSGPLRRCLRRKQRRLAECGSLSHPAPRTGEELERWIEEFLRVEAQGWKGARGTALACSEAGRAFFAQVIAGAFRRRRLLTLGLDCNGEPVARRCAFLAREGAFAFKTTYAERFAAFSPGALLEIDNLSQLAGLPQVRWMDSCAGPDNLLINRIANGRRTIDGLTIAVRPVGTLALTAQRLLHRTNQWLSRR